MSETNLLRSSAIVRNASVGATPPHGPVKTGELPHVHVKATPGGAQVREGQQKPVTILPPKDAQSAVAIGGLPMVQVKMTQNGPQPDDGRDNPVVIKDNRGTIPAGNLPMVQVKMENGRPTVQTAPNVKAGPPQIPGAAPALSAPRVAQAQGGPRVTRVPAPRPELLPAPVLPEVPELSAEQWLLYRHLVDKYHADLTASSTPSDSADDVAKSDAVKFAEATIDTIDQALVAVAVRAEAAAIAASAPVPIAAAAAVGNTYVAPRPVTGGHFSPASLSPTVPQNAGYVAQRPGTRTHVAGGGRTQGSSGFAPRRVQRRVPQPGEPTLPPVIVKMDGQRPVVQSPPVEQPTAESVAAVEASAPTDGGAA